MNKESVVKLRSRDLGQSDLPTELEQPWANYYLHTCGACVFSLCKDQRKVEGQQLKGKLVSALFHTFLHFPDLSHFSEFFSPKTFSYLKGLSVQRDWKIINENKQKKDQTILNVTCCTFVLFLNLGTACCACWCSLLAGLMFWDGQSALQAEPFRSAREGLGDVLLPVLRFPGTHFWRKYQGNLKVSLYLSLFLEISFHALPIRRYVLPIPYQTRSKRILGNVLLHEVLDSQSYPNDLVWPWKTVKNMSMTKTVACCKFYPPAPSALEWMVQGDASQYNVRETKDRVVPLVPRHAVKICPHRWWLWEHESSCL